MIYILIFEYFSWIYIVTYLYVYCRIIAVIMILVCLFSFFMVLLNFILIVVRVITSTIIIQKTCLEFSSLEKNSSCEIKQEKMWYKSDVFPQLALHWLYVDSLQCWCLGSKSWYRWWIVDKKIDENDGLEGSQMDVFSLFFLVFLVISCMARRIFPFCKVCKVMSEQIS